MPEVANIYEMQKPTTALKLVPLTSDPPLTKGLIWFRDDTKELRWTPDGTTVYVIDPAPVVNKGWSDTTPHWFPTGTTYTWYLKASIELNQPATDHKRAREPSGSGTGYYFIHGWLLKKNIKLSTRIDFNCYIGGYHGYNATRAQPSFAISDPNLIDKYTISTAYAYLYMIFTMSSLGYTNGSYNRPLSGYIVFTSPPSYSFSPANPSSVRYNLITNIPNIRTHILYGYYDSWATNYSIWASLSRYTTRLRYRVATKPPEPEFVDDIEVADWKISIARWDGVYRLWARKGSMGKVVELGKNVRIHGKKQHGKLIEPKTKFDSVIADTPKIKNADVFEYTIQTDIPNMWKKSNMWMLKVRYVEYEDGSDDVEVILGDRSWDGDKVAFLIY